MGEVYRATDTTLGREVALKLLPEAFAADPDRLARFEREAKVLASLNHPGIAHLYGFESATLPDGTKAHVLVMELVEGRGPRGAAEARKGPRRRGGRHREADRRGPRGGAREGHRPPGPQAREREGDAGREGQGPRLRPRQGLDGRGPGRHVEPRPLAVPHPGPDRHRRRPHPRHRRLHVARAGAGQAGRQARRHLGLRCRAVRDAGRPAAVRRRDGLGRPRRRPRARDRLEPPPRRNATRRPPRARALPRARPAPAPARHRGRPPRPARGRAPLPRAARRPRRPRPRATAAGPPS